MAPLARLARVDVSGHCEATVSMETFEGSVGGRGRSTREAAMGNRDPQTLCTVLGRPPPGPQRSYSWELDFKGPGQPSCRPTY